MRNRLSVPVAFMLLLMAATVLCPSPVGAAQALTAEELLIPQVKWEGVAMLFLLALLVSLVVEWAKSVYKRFATLVPDWVQVLLVTVTAIGAGFYFAWQTGTSLLATLGLPVKTPEHDVLVTGLILSGGAIFWYKAFVQRLLAWRDYGTPPVGSL